MLRRLRAAGGDISPHRLQAVVTEGRSSQSKMTKSNCLLAIFSSSANDDLRFINIEPYLLVAIQFSNTANQQLMQTQRTWGNWGVWSAFWRRCMKAEMLPDPFRGLMAKEPRTKHVSHKILNGKHNNCPWLALEKEQTFTILLWLATYLRALQLPEQIPAGALGLHPQPWE